METNTTEDEDINRNVLDLELDKEHSVGPPQDCDSPVIKFNEMIAKERNNSLMKDMHQEREVENKRKSIAVESIDDPYVGKREEENKE